METATLVDGSTLPGLSAPGAVEEEHVIGVQYVESQQKLMTKPSATHKKSSQSNLVMSSCVLSGRLETGLSV